jgi:site-specific recombinase XerD
MEADQPLFATKNGLALDRNNVRHLVGRAGERAGVENVHPHRFRHTFAVEFLRNGGNVFELQMALGHETLDMVRNYAELAQIDLNKAMRKASPADRWRL